jgi:hypothetical protein
MLRNERGSTPQRSYLGLTALLTAVVTITQLMALVVGHEAYALAPRGTEQRNVDCTVARLNCTNACPPYWTTQGQSCIGLCDVAFVQCLNQPDAAGSRSPAPAPGSIDRSNPRTQ